MDSLEQQVRIELKKGGSKKNIFKKLATANNKDDLVWYLDQYPTAQKRQKILWIYYLLITILLIITVKKLYFIALIQLNAIAIGQFSPLLLVDLLVPAIHFYILTKIVRFDRQGYQFGAVLTLLALVRPENRIMPDFIMYLFVVASSVFLMLYLFPKQDQLEKTKKLASS
ncbi:MAG: hypothetical protein D3918_07365 [Candidatus Electrothrix sp. AX2]|nr:hypothetical protein [Candidatus Electrothrix gigas]